MGRSRNALTRSSICSQNRDTWLSETPLMPHGLNEILDRAGRDALDGKWAIRRGSRKPGNESPCEVLGSAVRPCRQVHHEKISSLALSLLDRFLRRCRPCPLPPDVGDRISGGYRPIAATSPARTVATHGEHIRSQYKAAQQLTGIPCTIWVDVTVDLRLSRPFVLRRHPGERSDRGGSPFEMNRRRA